MMDGGHDPTRLRCLRRAALFVLLLLLIVSFWRTKGEIKSGSALDLESIGSEPAAPHVVETTAISEDAALPLLFCRRATESGAVVLIVAGIHGDEPASFEAAEQLKKMPLDRGILYILSPVNVIGAKNHERRFGDHDLNRAFPGDAQGDEAERAAAVLMRVIRQIQPDLILDLHEARAHEAPVDFLGNSLIFTELGDVSESFFSLVADPETEAGISVPINTFSPGVAGSLNRVAAEQYRIPVLTVESFQGEAMEQRIHFHQRIVGYFLHQMKMQDSQEITVETP